METSDRQVYQAMVQEVQTGPSTAGYQPLQLITPQGVVHCRYYAVPEAKWGAIWVGGVGGDWDTPAQGLYPSLCEELMAEGIASLRVQFRQPTQLQEAVLDVLLGISFLQDQGIQALALTGHSFGGAVVIQAAAQVQAVRTVVALATQSYGTNQVTELATQCSLLLIHGFEDEVLPPACSQQVFARALEPKHLILYPGASHSLNQVATEVHQVVHDWILTQFQREV